MSQRQRPDTDRILASIDATVQQRCACGCGAQLDPNGASMWFASQDCQSRFQQRQTTNPEEVLARPDAAPVYPDHDDRPIGLVTAAPTPPITDQPLTVGDLRRAYRRIMDAPLWSTEQAASAVRRFLEQESGEASGVDLYTLLSAAEMLHHSTGFSTLERLPPPPPPTRPDPTPVTAIAPSEEGWQPASAGPLPWRRQCGSCQHYTEPQERQYIPDVHRIAALYDVPADLLSLSSGPPPPTALCDACRHCRQPFPGPRMLPQWRYRDEAHRHEVRLAAADACVVVGVSGELVDDADRPTLRTHVWADLERALTDRLTWRDPCAINGCHAIARAEFALIAVPGLPHRLKVCPRHETDLMRSPAYRFQP